MVAGVVGITQIQKNKLWGKVLWHSLRAQRLRSFMYILSSSYSVNSLLFSFKNISIHDFSFVILLGYGTLVTGENKMQSLRDTEKEKSTDSEKDYAVECLISQGQLQIIIRFIVVEPSLCFRHCNTILGFSMVHKFYPWYIQSKRSLRQSQRNEC